MLTVVLAGGLGTRLRDLVHDVPKPMASVAGRPFLEYVLHNLIRSGSTSFVLSVGYKANVIREHFGSQFLGVPISYAIERKPLGTGGALFQIFKNAPAETALVVNGDTYIELSPGQLTADLKRVSPPFLYGCRVTDASRYGLLEVHHEFVVGFGEKKGHGEGIINGGYYCFPTNLFSGFPINSSFSLETDFLVPNLLSLNLRVIETGSPFIDIGVPSDFIRAQGMFANYELGES